MALRAELVGPYCSAQVSEICSVLIACACVKACACFWRECLCLGRVRLPAVARCFGI